MIKNELIILLVILIPVLGSFILPVLGWISRTLRNLTALILAFSSFLLLIKVLPLALSGAIISMNQPLILGINFVLHADLLAVFMALVSSFISTIIVFYSLSYISHYENQNEYYFMVLLFMGSMMGLVFAGNLILLYVFWEITALTSWRLIGFFREKRDVLRADKAFMVTVFGALMMLMGFIILYQNTGSFDMAVIKTRLLTHHVPDLAVILILIGIFSKSAMLPFHTWLPDAGVAPSPVTALLHAAVLVKIGVYVFARLFVVTFTLSTVWHTIVPWLAAASALVSAGAALIETDLKRIIAYSTISQIAFILLGLSIGNEIGIAGGLLYILMHGIAKGGLFLCAGIVEQNTGTKDITRMGGLISTMPVTAVSFLLCSFSVMGIPPFGGFFSKYMVIAGAFQSGNVLIAATFLLGAVLTILYLFRMFNMVFLGDERMSHAREGSASMVGSVAFLALLSLLGGIVISYPAGFVQLAVKQMMGI